jgi:hypothetical protein
MERCELVRRKDDRDQGDQLPAATLHGIAQLVLERTREAMSRHYEQEQARPEDGNAALGVEVELGEKTVDAPVRQPDPGERGQRQPERDQACSWQRLRQGMRSAFTHPARSAPFDPGRPDWLAVRPTAKELAGGLMRGSEG